MRRLAAALVLVAAFAAGCGSGGSSRLLRDSEAAGLKQTLDQVRSAVAARNVGACAARVRQLRAEISNLPDRVDRRLRARLRDEVAGKLAPQVTRECDDPLVETQPTVTTPAPTGPSGPTAPPEDQDDQTQTQTTPSVPSATVPTPSVPEDTTPTLPSDPGDGSGGFGDDDGTAP